MVVQEPFTDAEPTNINREMELYWSPEDTVILGHDGAGQEGKAPAQQVPLGERSHG